MICMPSWLIDDFRLILLSTVILLETNLVSVPAVTCLQPSVLGACPSAHLADVDTWPRPRLRQPPIQPVHITRVELSLPSEHPHWL